MSRLSNVIRWPGWAVAKSGDQPRRRPRLSLALQGGGAHGAYTWGVLDALLEAGRFELDAISGTSAGAMNAIALAHGMATGGVDGAREALQRFWLGVAAQVPFEWFTAGDDAEPGLSPAARVLLQWSQMLSPYQLNPLGLNPLRDLLTSQIDFERLRGAPALPLFIAATHANTGRLRLFRNAELTVDVALASACLPTLHHAVQIDGEPYWDGGYSANPALFPLTWAERADDVLIVMLSPLVHGATPVKVDEIRARAVEIAFSAPFLREAQLLGEACAEARGALLRFGSLERRLARMRWHLIDAQDALGHLPGETKLIALRAFLERLHALGRERAQRWIDESGPAVGVASSVDLVRMLT